MPKPGTVKGVQAILWTLTALALLGDLFSTITLIDAFTPVGMVTLVIAVYFTAQSLISPIHIERGKRWAWIWSVVSAALGLAAALAAIVAGIQISQYSALPLVIGFALGSLYGVLLGLLLSKSARAWILMHRIQRGEVQAVSESAEADAMGVRPQRPQRPERKPGVVTVVQVLLALLVVPGVLAFLQQFEYYRHEADIWGHSAFSTYMDRHFEVWVIFFSLGFAGLAVLVVNLLVAWGLGRGRKGARVFGGIWLGVLFAAMGAGSPIMHMFMRMQEDDTMSLGGGHWVDDPFEATWLPVAFWALTVGAILAIVAFVLVLHRGTRVWTPGKPPSIVIVHHQVR